MRRTFEVSAHVAPHTEKPDAAFFDGAPFAPIDAARRFCRLRLPGYDVIPCGRIDAPRLWRFEAINHATQCGAVLWVREK